ncbi:unnamed protein product [Nezara viridula]|uniref:Uncharacterized protein n=1 Tax=Nezara viridula TaxID=85310 RepID=A0A9P0HR94_NEZVI|nr:unnamed protein product [Nezara viridula]
MDLLDSNLDLEIVFGGCGALVFVIDAQDDYMDALNKLNVTVTKAFKVNPNIKFETFIHKVDGLTEDNKMETQRDIHQRANDDLSDAEINAEQKIDPLWLQIKEAMFHTAVAICGKKKINSGSKKTHW